MIPAELEHRASAITRSDLDLEGMCLALDGILRKEVPYMVAAWSTQDPATGLFTSCTISGMPKDLEREALLFSFEYRDDEPSTFRELIAQRRSVAILSEETDGDPSRAARFRGLLAGFGCVDELRAVLWADDSPWGSIVLYSGDRRFTSKDAETVERMAPIAAEGVRLALLRAAASRPEAMLDPPGILRIGAGGEVVPLTSPARRWLELGGSQLVTAANAVAAAVRDQQFWPGATSRLPVDGSRVLALHGATMTGEAGDVAVIVEAARPAQVATMLIDAYGLTSRQREVLGLLLLGRSIAQIARQLDISEHTTNDHRKAIYARLGVQSRSQLAALLQSDQYDPRVHAGVPPSPYGGFLATGS